MRFLFCPIDSPGYFFPAIGIALNLRNRQHEVAFVSGKQSHHILEREKLERIPFGSRDVASFEITSWGSPFSVIKQVKHIEYGLACFKPDVIVGTELGLGSILSAELHAKPIAVIGLMSYLFPVSNKVEKRPSSSLSHSEKRAIWRYTQRLMLYNKCRKLVNLPSVNTRCEEAPFLGDLFFLRSIPRLWSGLALPPDRVHFVGDCLWEPSVIDRRLKDWLEDSAALNYPIIYVQVGAHFGAPNFWPYLVKVLKDQPVRIAASLGSMKGGSIRTPELTVPPNFIVDYHIPQGVVMPYAQAVISSGNTTSVLGALRNGLPILIIPNGGEQKDNAEYCQRIGVSLTLSPHNMTEKVMEDTIKKLLQEPKLRHQSLHLMQMFKQIDGFKKAADLLEILATKGGIISRVGL